MGTGVGVAAMLAPGLFVWQQFVTVPADATEVEVVGQQWQWSFRLPGKDGKLGTSDTRIRHADNPLGFNPNDPNGQDDIVVVGDDLHLPVGKPVKMLLRAIDVVHDFYVPEFRAKMDMIPGAITYYLVHADQDRRLRCPLRGIVRHRSSLYARHCRRRRRRRSIRPGCRSRKTFAQMSTAAQQRASQVEGLSVRLKERMLWLM